MKTTEQIIDEIKARFDQAVEGERPILSREANALLAAYARTDLPRLLEAFKVLWEVLREIDDYQTIIHAPEHEKSHALGVEIPHLVQEAKQKAEQILRGEV